MNVAEVAFEKWNSDANLWFIEIGLREAKSIKESLDAGLPSIGQLATIPIQFHLDCFELALEEEVNLP